MRLWRRRRKPDYAHIEALERELFPEWFPVQVSAVARFGSMSSVLSEYYSTMAMDYNETYGAQTRYL